MDLLKKFIKKKLIHSDNAPFFKNLLCISRSTFTGFDKINSDNNSYDNMFIYFIHDIHLIGVAPSKPFFVNMSDFFTTSEDFEMFIPPEIGRASCRERE